MPDFMAQYLQALAAQRDAFHALIDDRPTDEIESALREAIKAHWQGGLPDGATSPLDCFAVDGSDAMRGFDNGTFLVVSHALLAGPNVEQSATNVTLQRETLSSDSRERLRGLLTRALEIRLALEHVAACGGGTLYLDGSIYAQLGHLIYPYEATEHADIPLVLLEHYLDLIDACRLHNVQLVALSKTTRGHLLAHAFLPDDDGPAQLLPSRQRANDVNIPSDGEALARWTHGSGQTYPCLVGWEAFGDRASQFVQAPESLIRAFERAGVESSRTQTALERLRRMPAVWASYARLEDSDDPIRIECLADTLMPDCPTVTDFSLRIEPVGLGREILAQAIADHTTPRLYNTGLYVADRLVRLARATVDDKYLPLLREALQVPLRLNRSERRFHSF